MEINDRVEFFFVSAGNTGRHGEVEADQYLQQVRAVCEYSGNDWYRVYLLRALYRVSGMDCILSLMNIPTWRWVFPADLLRLQVELSYRNTELLYEG